MDRGNFKIDFEIEIITHRNSFFGWFALRS
jgi:hypothetical protein